MTEAESTRGPARFESGIPDVGVHVLGEHVFCPRAALLALESSEEDERDDERTLGPKLDWFGDYNERRFIEALHATWGTFRFWLALLAPALLLVFVVGVASSWFWGLAASLPAALMLAKLWDTVVTVVRIVRERAAWQAALPCSIDLNSTEIRGVNWWSLRKAGFDCIKPQQKNRDPTERLVGKPWRVLVQERGALRIPVIRKHKGNRDYGRQHVVRMAAHCRLLEECERANAPFGVLIFAGSYDCVIFPNTAEAKSQLQRELVNFREFLRFVNSGGVLPEPTDRRCSGCYRGAPRRYVRDRSETVLKGELLPPLSTKSKTGVRFHCDCGDRFGWVPRHRDSIQLGIVDDV